jgi:hypothetical protein
MAQSATIRAMVPAWVAWPSGSRARRLMLIAVGIMLAVAIGAVALAARTVFAPPSGAQQMFEDIRYAAIFTGRDSDAAVRKAKLRVHLLMRDFGMSRTRAAEYVARVMIEQSGGLCSGI